jgi:hypothetical protein
VKLVRRLTSALELTSHRSFQSVTEHGSPYSAAHTESHLQTLSTNKSAFRGIPTALLMRG